LPKIEKSGSGTFIIRSKPLRGTFIYGSYSTGIYIYCSGCKTKCLVLNCEPSFICKQQAVPQMQDFLLFNFFFFFFFVGKLMSSVAGS